MDFCLNNEQVAMREMARQFADDQIAPFAAEWDEKHIFPIETLRKAASLGLAAICVRSDLGGSDLKRLDSVIVFEEHVTSSLLNAMFSATQ